MDFPVSPGFIVGGSLSIHIHIFAFFDTSLRSVNADLAFAPKTELNLNC